MLDPTSRLHLHMTLMAGAALRTRALVSLPTIPAIRRSIIRRHLLLLNMVRLSLCLLTCQLEVASLIRLVITIPILLPIHPLLLSRLLDTVDMKRKRRQQLARRCPVLRNMSNTVRHQ